MDRADVASRMCASVVVCAPTQVLDKEPEKHGACVVSWADEDEADASVEQQRSAMASFLGKVKRQKTEDRHRWLHEAHLEPVDAW